MFFLSVFKATPTLWQLMAAATPDLLLAMAINSQVSVFDSWGVGNMGGGLHLGEGEPLKRALCVHISIKEMTCRC